MAMSKEYIILVNHSGRRIGTTEKLAAHQNGLLHRAFSIFLLNSKNEMLLQKRASSKYHFAGLWSNACCSHPRPLEKVLSAARRRLKEELRISTSLSKVDHIIYSFTDRASGLTEHEFDYLLLGKYDGEIFFNPNEIEAIKWISVPRLKKWMKREPSVFTPWFKMAMEKLDELAPLT